MSEQSRWNERLASYRKTRGWTQNELAEALGVTITQVNRWENGRSEPSKDSLKRFEALLHGQRVQTDSEKLDEILIRLDRLERKMEQCIDMFNNKS